MPTKNFIYLFICFFIFISCKVGQPTYCQCDKCECEIIRQKEQYVDDSPVNQVFDYIPKKAGAKIAAQITFENVSFVGYQNHCFYAVAHEQDNDCIRFFDIENDKIAIKKEILIPRSAFAEDYALYSVHSVNVINGTIVLLAKIINQRTNKKVNSLLTFDENDNTLSFYERSSDFDNLSVIKTFYYDASEEKAYLSDNAGYDMRNGNKELLINVYHYDKSAHKWIADKSFYYDISIRKSHNVFLTNRHIIISYYFRRPDRVTGNYLVFYQKYKPHICKKLNLTFLGLKNEIKSAFSDDAGSIWLYGYDVGLVKLKILHNKSAKNEYNEYWFKCSKGESIRQNILNHNKRVKCCKCDSILKRVRTFDDLVCDDDPNNYEWSHYSIDDFSKDYPPEKFQ